MRSQADTRALARMRPSEYRGCASGCSLPEWECFSAMLLLLMARHAVTMTVWGQIEGGASTGGPLPDHHRLAAHLLPTQGRQMPPFARATPRVHFLKYSPPAPSAINLPPHAMSTDLVPPADLALQYPASDASSSSSPPPESPHHPTPHPALRVFTCDYTASPSDSDSLARDIFAPSPASSASTPVYLSPSYPFPAFPDRPSSSASAGALPDPGYQFPPPAPRPKAKSSPAAPASASAAARAGLAHPYARLYTKKDGKKRRKMWNHALEKAIFTPHEISTMSAPHRRTIYTASLEAHIDRLHAQLLGYALFPVPFEKLECFHGLNSKTAKSMVSGLYHDASELRMKILELERSSQGIRNMLSAPPGPLPLRRHSLASKL
ncbi:hypothetical protein AcW2_000721 [Taiwanofungus camphoratus]|nr:hypothetical protein AcW2_000721 [Antrodia cinnamomea]